MAKIDFEYFENVLVKNAMLDASYLTSIVDYVKPKYFDNKNIAKYFEIVSDFYDKHQKLPTMTEIKVYLTSDELKRGFKILIESFKDVDNNLDKDELYTNTERFLKEKGTYHAILESAEEIGEEATDLSLIVDRFEKISGISLNTDKGIELYGDVEKIIDDILSEQSTISSKWDWFDEHSGGGFRESGKALYVFAGQANIGKSIVLGNIAENIASQGKTVLVVTLEMSETLYGQRIASKVTKIPMKNFKEDAHTLRCAMNQEKSRNPKGKIFIKEFPPSTITPKQLQAFCKKLVDSGEKLDAIVIDYISLLHSPQGSNSYERVKYVCEQVRAMSYVFGCPCITACQINRSGYNGSPGMEHMAESLGIAATADDITTIFQNEEDQELGVVRFGKAKNRFGMRGMVQTMRIDYSTLTITQSDEECEFDDSDDDDEISLLEKLSA